MCDRYDHPPYDGSDGNRAYDPVTFELDAINAAKTEVAFAPVDPEPDCPCGHMADEHDLRGQTSDSYDCLACARDHREGEHDTELQLAGCCQACAPLIAFIQPYVDEAISLGNEGRRHFQTGELITAKAMVDWQLERGVFNRREHAAALRLIGQ